MRGQKTWRRFVLPMQENSMLTNVAWLLVAAVLLSLTACASKPPCPVVQVEPYSPPSQLMRPAPTQFLLPPELQRSVPKQPSN